MKSIIQITIFSMLFLSILGSTLLKSHHANLKVEAKNNKLTKTVVKSVVKSKAKEFDGLFLSALTNPAWRYDQVCSEQKKDYSKMETASSNRVYQKSSLVHTPRFSLPPSASVANLLNTFLGEQFKTESKATFDSFGKGAQIFEKDIILGFGQNQWKIEGDLDTLGAYYYNTYDTDKTKGLDIKEFTYLMTDVLHDYSLNYKCLNCLAETRKEISNFFTFLDCDTKGFVQAVNLYHVFKKMNGGENIKSVDVNDWLLKEDNRGIGRLDRKQFTDAVLKSLYEVNVLHEAITSPAAETPVTTH